MSVYVCVCVNMCAYMSVCVMCMCVFVIGYACLCECMGVCVSVCVECVHVCVHKDSQLLGRIMAVSDIDDFIVDDEGRPISKGKKKKHIIHSDKYVVVLFTSFYGTGGSTS